MASVLFRDDVLLLLARRRSVDAMNRRSFLGTLALLPGLGRITVALVAAAYHAHMLPRELAPFIAALRDIGDLDAKPENG